MSATVTGRPALAGATSRALGTSVHVVVTRPDELERASAAVKEVLVDIDHTCSRFRDDSEISRLRALRGRPARISPLLFTALRAALRGAVMTDGAVDPTVGTAVHALGYTTDFAGVPPVGEAITITATASPGWQALQLDEAASTVLVPTGVELDLGSTAKALASDLAATAAMEHLTGGVLVNLGGDIAVAGEPPDGGWVIQVSESSDDPLADGREAIAISSGGVATSSTTVRRWRRGAVELHHIVDPTTGLPTAGSWRTVTCVAGTCLDANIASTAAVVKGRDAVRWLSDRALPSRLVDGDGAVLRTSGWPAPLRTTEGAS